MQNFQTKEGGRVKKNVSHLGTTFVVSRKILNLLIHFQSPNGRVSTLPYTNKAYTLYKALIYVHAPINRSHKTNREKRDKFQEELEEIITEVPNWYTVILLGDFTVQLGREKKFRNIVVNYPAHKGWNRNG